METLQTSEKMRLSTVLARSFVVLLMSAWGCLPLTQGSQGLGGGGPPEISIPLMSPFQSMWLMESMLRCARQWCQMPMGALVTEVVRAVNACSGSKSSSPSDGKVWSRATRVDLGTVAAGMMNRFPRELTLQRIAPCLLRSVHMSSRKLTCAPFLAS